MKPGREASVAWAAVTKQQERRIWANNCPKEIGGWGGTKELNFPLQTHVSLAFRGCLSQTLGFGYFPEIHRRIFFFFFFPPSLWTTSSCELGWGYTLVWLCRVPAWLGPRWLLQGQGWICTAWKRLWLRADIGHSPWKPRAHPATPGCRATETEWKYLSSSLTALWLAKRKKCGRSYIFGFIQSSFSYFREVFFHLGARPFYSTRGF